MGDHRLGRESAPTPVVPAIRSVLQVLLIIVPRSTTSWEAFLTPLWWSIAPNRPKSPVFAPAALRGTRFGLESRAVGRNFFAKSGSFWSTPWDYYCEYLYTHYEGFGLERNALRRSSSHAGRCVPGRRARRAAGHAGQGFAAMSVGRRSMTLNPMSSLSRAIFQRGAAEIRRFMCHTWFT